MSDTASPRLGLPYLAASQAQKHVTLNTMVAQLDGLVQCAVESRSLAVQPTAPTDGQMWVLPAGATGAAWTGNGGALLRYEASAWSVLAVSAGQLAFVKDEQRLVVNGAGGWSPLPTSSNGGLRNRLINGAFQIWQRGATIACAANQSTFTSDRWQVWSAGAASSARRLTTGLPAGVAAALQVTGAAGVTSAAISQTLESAMIGDLAGQSVTLSALVYASTALSPSLNLYQYGVTDSSASRAFVTSYPLGQVGPGWSLVSRSFVLPAGIANGGQVEFGFGALGAGVTVGLAQVQLEAGQAGTSFEVRGPGAEMALCQRYFQLTAPVYGASGQWTAAGAATVVASLSPPMRTTPSCAPVGGGAITIDCAGVGASSTSSFSVTASPTNLVLSATGLTPPRTAGGLAGCNTQIACLAEL